MTNAAQHIVVVGSSPAGVHLLRECRQTLKANVTLLPLGAKGSPLRERFPAVIAQTSQPAEAIHCLFQDLIKEGVDVRAEAGIRKIHAHRKYIVLENKERLSFDTLILTDAETLSFGDVKGTQRQGVTGLRHLQDLQTVLSRMSLVDTAIVQGDSWMALETVVALKRQLNDVIWIVPGEHIMETGLDAESAELITGHCEDLGVRIIMQNLVRDILGEADVKAVRLASGKIVAAQLVIMTDAPPHLRWLHGMAADASARMENDATGLSLAPDVYVMDQAFRPGPGQGPYGHPMDWKLSILEQQAERVMASLQQTTNDREWDPFVHSMKIGSMPVSVLGRTSVGRDTKILRAWTQPGDGYLKIFSEKDEARGAVLFDAEEFKEEWLQRIQEHATIVPNGQLEEEIMSSMCGSS